MDVSGQRRGSVGRLSVSHEVCRNCIDLWNSGIIGYYGNSVDEVAVGVWSELQKCDYPLQYSLLVYEKVMA